VHLGEGVVTEGIGGAATRESLIGATEQQPPGAEDLLDRIRRGISRELEN
jgi:hypothetical protein